MASVYRDSARDGWRVQVYVRGVRRKLWVGPVSKSAAMAIGRNLDALVLARDTGTVASETVRAWVRGISPRIRKRLIAWGLADVAAAADPLPTTLGAFWEAYRTERSDWKERTRLRWRASAEHILAELGSDTDLLAVTVADAGRFARWARANFADSHAGKLISDAKHLFRVAVDSRQVPENPFAKIDCRQRHDSSRGAYVSAEIARRLMSASDPYYAALIASARFGGLRVPSEPLALRWSTIDWESQLIVVDSPKTGLRTIPIFAAMRPSLEELYANAPEGSDWVFFRSRRSLGTAARQRLLQAARVCGVEPWPKLWMNLRASCRTDLLNDFPAHVVNAWLGHSGKVGAEHYDRVHSGHIEQAVGSPVGSMPGEPRRAQASGK